MYFLNTVRFATGGSLGGSEGGSEGEEEEEVVSAEKISASAAGVGLEAKGATLTFRDVNYIVKASTSDDKLHLLKGINGYFAKGLTLAQKLGFELDISFEDGTADMVLPLLE